MNRIVESRGWQYCLDTYEASLQKARSLTPQEIDGYFDNVIWPTLKKYRVSSTPSKALSDDEVEDRKPRIRRRWLKFAEPERCRLHVGSKGGTGYPEVSVRLGNDKANSSKKLPLHQMPARKQEMEEQGQLSNWKDGDKVASHLCNQKLCLVCGVKEPRAKNLARGYCTCFRIVNTKLVWVCTHEPKCRDLGVNAFWEDD